MTPAIKAIAGVVSLCAIVPSSYAVYHVLSSNNTPSRKRLENSGYSLEPPKLSPSNKVNNRYGCADRLFKEMKVSGMKPDPSDKAVYGCALMLLETTQDDKFSDFNSHIAIRKGNEGWIINVFVGGTGMMDYTYIELKYLGHEWTQESWRWSNNNATAETEKNLIIKVPGADWFNGSVSLSRSAGSIDPKKLKEFNKAWISSKGGTQEWILKDVMVAKGSEDESQIFCPKETTKISECFQNLETVNKARKGVGEFTGAKQESVKSVETDIPKNKIKEAYQTLSSSKGSWIELSEICNYGENGDIDLDQQKKLEMFCAVAPNKNTGVGISCDDYVPALPSGEDGDENSDLEVAISLPS